MSSLLVWIAKQEQGWPDQMYGRCRQRTRHALALVARRIGIALPTGLVVILRACGISYAR
jgi:hypothetical protein